MSESDAAEIRSCVIFRDEHILVLNKPPKLATQGGTKQQKHIDGMASALRFGSDRDPLLVHRLDKDTSGVLLMARTASSARILSAMFRRRQVEKKYWAVVSGFPEPSAGVISMPLYRSHVGGSGKMRCVPPERAGDFFDAKHAITRYAVLEALGRRLAAVALDPVTGRTHQLRAHLAGFGHPIIGDQKYGGDVKSISDENRTSEHGLTFEEGLHLHARSLAIEHPVSGDLLQFEAPLPQHMHMTFRALGWNPREFPRNRFAASEWL